MNDTLPAEPWRERPEWGPQADGLYRSPVPPKVTAAMAEVPTRPADLPGTIVAAPSHALPRSHRWLALRSHPAAPSAAEVAAVLNELDASYVLVGGHAVGCWSASARSTADADFVVFIRDFRRAQDALRSRFPGLRLEEHDAVARFTVAAADGTDGTEEAVDLIRSYDSLMLSALANSVTVMAGAIPISIPCPEAQVALKVAAVRSPSRAAPERMQDAADIAQICAGRSLREDLLEALSTAVGGTAPGFLPGVVRIAQSGGDVVAACRASG